MARKNLARKEPEVEAQESGLEKALRAASTAISTSSAVAAGMSPETGHTHETLPTDRFIITTKKLNRSVVETNDFLRGRVDDRNSLFQEWLSPLSVCEELTGWDWDCHHRR